LRRGRQFQKDLKEIVQIYFVDAKKIKKFEPKPEVKENPRKLKRRSTTEKRKLNRRIKNE